MLLQRQALSLFLSASVVVLSAPASPGRERRVDLSPLRWPAGEYAKYMKEQAAERMSAGSEINGPMGAIHRGRRFNGRNVERQLGLLCS
jgi:hypothetical protein